LAGPDDVCDCMADMACERDHGNTAASQVTHVAGRPCRGTLASATQLSSQMGPWPALATRWPSLPPVFGLKGKGTASPASRQASGTRAHRSGIPPSALSRQLLLDRLRPRAVCRSCNLMSARFPSPTAESRGSVHWRHKLIRVPGLRSSAEEIRDRTDRCQPATLETVSRCGTGDILVAD
jgi:hypothetical protein